MIDIILELLTNMQEASDVSDVMNFTDDITTDFMIDVDFDGIIDEEDIFIDLDTNGFSDNFMHYDLDADGVIDQWDVNLDLDNDFLHDTIDPFIDANSNGLEDGTDPFQNIDNDLHFDSGISEYVKELKDIYK